jgi:hypothetical protein
MNGSYSPEPSDTARKVLFGAAAAVLVVGGGLCFFLESRGVLSKDFFYVGMTVTVVLTSRLAFGGVRGYL